MDAFVHLRVCSEILSANDFHCQVQGDRRYDLKQIFAEKIGAFDSKQS
jgi:hypothetical protein